MGSQEGRQSLGSLRPLFQRRKSVPSTPFSSSGHYPCNLASKSL
jgi:hypothetical protein